MGVRSAVLSHFALLIRRMFDCSRGVTHLSLSFFLSSSPPHHSSFTVIISRVAQAQSPLTIKRTTGEFANVHAPGMHALIHARNRREREREKETETDTEGRRPLEIVGDYL